MRTSRLEVVTPLGRVLVDDVESVIAPGLDGYVGVLIRHAPFMTALKPGILYYRRAGDKTKCMAVSGGFMEVGPDKIIVLADTAELAANIDVERARRAKERAEKRLHERPPGLDVARAELALARSFARLKAAGAADDSKYTATGAGSS